ncbi:hypothetical protein PAXRUDRAFT_20492 [Paxillus rubicundulus Ve08.2h10]|uniref:Uncharacterized protein n=1 Tax=Paxillus rubicundulus Ve08.2h10 TaxID=930991 RepID=A0A0D0D1L4_9AGAM|nr:hypothetical protein PAXRUDRAFT_20492 [Paxillus rubicundulus Ve08.2h10]
MPLVTQKAKFGIDVGLTPSESIKASTLNLITTPVNPLLDPLPRPSLDLKDQIIKGLGVQVDKIQ